MAFWLHQPYNPGVRRFFVFSRPIIEINAAHDVPHVLISITSPDDNPATLQTNKHTRGVLRLSFWDHRDEWDAAGREQHEPIFSTSMAREIWALVLANPDADVIVHCDEGASRSPGVVAALAQVLKGDDSDWRRIYHPNSRVYRLMLETAPGGPYVRDVTTPAAYLGLLAEAERALVHMLYSPEAWNSLDVSYEPPRVERLWKDWKDGHRIYLHRIHPCDTALFHPHPWPSAVKVLSGQYEMGIGYGKGQERPPVAALTVLTAGATYAMTDPNGWHWVRPIGGPSLSLMVTGPKWERWAPRPDFTLHPLSEKDHKRLVDDFKEMIESDGLP